MGSKRVFVTGGSGGLGSAICKRFASSGYIIHFTGRNKEAAERLLNELPPAGAFFHELDVLDTPALQKLSLRLAQEFESLEVLVNCAGMSSFVAAPDLDSLDDQLIDRIFQVNVRAPLALIRALRPLLEKGRGSIVNISSIAAKLALGSNIAYCASKAALNNLTVSLARVFAPHVRVLAVAPGLIETDFIKSMPEEKLALQRQLTPLQRFAQPEHVADAVFAAATVLTCSTGIVIEVDGGRLVGV